jgi:hypothetical protein
VCQLLFVLFFYVEQRLQLTLHVINLERTVQIIQPILVVDRYVDLVLAHGTVVPIHVHIFERGIFSITTKTSHVLPFL